MAEFVHPFSGMVPDRKMTREELIRAIRLDIAAEQEAAHLYEAQADATDNPIVAEVLREIAKEEIVHVGEFEKLLISISPEEADLMNKGAEEVYQKVGNINLPIESKGFQVGNVIHNQGERYRILATKDEGYTLVVMNLSNEEVSEIPLTSPVTPESKGQKKMNILDEAKDLNVYKRLLKVLGEYAREFPGTGVSRMFDHALEHGKKILPKDKLAVGILHYVLKTSSVPEAVHKLLNTRLSCLPVELRPLVKNGRRKEVAHWSRGALVSDKVKDLIDWKESGKAGTWSDVEGNKVKLHDLSQGEEK